MALAEAEQRDHAAQARMVLREPGPQERDARRWQQRRWLIERSLAAGVPLVLLALWQAGVWAGTIDRRFFGSPVTVVQTALRLIETGTLQSHLEASVYRLLMGYGIGVAIGIPVGLVLGQIRLARAAFEPLLNALYVVPKLALLPILLLLLPGREGPLITLVAVAVFFIMAISSLAAALMTPAGYIDVARSFTASRWVMFRRVVFANALPQIFAALRLASGAAVLMLVGSEFVAASSGIGYLVWHSWSLFLADQMYVGIITIALLGVLFSALIGVLERFSVPWAASEGFKGNG